jgi:hypothetical protein
MGCLGSDWCCHQYNGRAGLSLLEKQKCGEEQGVLGDG